MQIPRKSADADVTIPAIAFVFPFSALRLIIPNVRPRTARMKAVNPIGSSRKLFGRAKQIDMIPRTIDAIAISISPLQLDA